MRTPEQTLADLETIAARANAAPGRPWYVIISGFHDGASHILSAQYDDAVLMSMGGDIPDEHRAAAARFVVSAIDDVPNLVALVRWLLARLDALRDDNTYLHTVAQGIAHYTRCSEELPCVRCQRDTLRDQTHETMKE